jgi:hypothetical protein
MEVTPSMSVRTVKPATAVANHRTSYQESRKKRTAGR